MSLVGKELKRERELRSVTLSEIAEETKISLRILEAIDSDRMDIIPGEFYRRACIRAYARYLGIDGDRIVATYHFSACSGSFRPRLSGSSSTLMVWLKNLTRGIVSRWAVLVVMGLALSGAVVAVWPVGDPERPPVEMALSGLTSPTEISVPEPIIREELEEEPSGEHRLRLLLRVDEPCWLEVHADGTLAAQGLMLRGYQKEIGAEEEIRLWLGNAGGVSIWINGRPGLPLGHLGEVRKNVRITLDNLSEFVASGDSPVEGSSEEGEADREGDRSRSSDANGL